MLSTNVLAQGIYWSQFVLNLKMLVGTFNQEKALVGAFSVIMNLRVDLRLKLQCTQPLSDPIKIFWSKKPRLRPAAAAAVGDPWLLAWWCQPGEEEKPGTADQEAVSTITDPGPKILKEKDI